MSIYQCKICSQESTSKQGLGIHIAHKHKISSKEYYDTHLKQDGDGKCEECGKDTGFGNGRYNRFCCSQCITLNHRKALKNNPERFAAYKATMSGHMKRRWSDPKTPDMIALKENSCQTRAKLVSKMSKQERLERFSWYYTMDPEKLEKHIEKAGEIALKNQPNGYGHCKQGVFKPRNPKKYVGDAENIQYRSWLEFRMMSYLDNQAEVIRWASEEIAVPYLSPKDKRMHRYFPDFWVEIKMADGKIVRKIIEIKPSQECLPPVPPKKETKTSRMRYAKACLTFSVNQAKWNSCKQFCAENNFEFLVMTEKDLGVIYG